MPKECTYKNKSELRELLLRQRLELADKPELSRLACERAAELVCGNVMVYIPIGSELDTSRLIEILGARSDVTLFAPFTENGNITPKRLLFADKPDKIGNISEKSYGKPLEITEKLDFCITPLLGFNGDGYRIGYGKGCYDRFFARHSCKKIGIAFERQRASFLPEFHDVPLDCCVTEQNVIYF